jgi:hypothetical protein
MANENEILPPRPQGYAQPGVQAGVNRTWIPQQDEESLLGLLGLAEPDSFISVARAMIAQQGIGLERGPNRMLQIVGVRVQTDSQL